MTGEMNHPSILIKKKHEPVMLDFSHEYGEMDHTKAEKCIRDYTQGHDGEFTLEWYKDGKLIQTFKANKG